MKKVTKEACSTMMFLEILLLIPFPALHKRLCSLPYKIHRLDCCECHMRTGYIIMTSPQFSSSRTTKTSENMHHQWSKIMLNVHALCRHHTRSTVHQSIHGTSTQMINSNSVECVWESFGVSSIVLREAWLREFQKWYWNEPILVAVLVAHLLRNGLVLDEATKV
jgi:hypothetical protein